MGLSQHDGGKDFWDGFINANYDIGTPYTWTAPEHSSDGV